MNIEYVRQLTEPFDACQLECDGLTRVLHTVLHNKQMSHSVMLGTVKLSVDKFTPHYWISLPNKHVVDYRARMWLGEEAQHGVFLPVKTKYVGKEIAMLVLSDFLFYALVDGCDQS